MTYQTTAETATELRMSSRVLCEKAARGEIRASKVGRQWLFEPAAIAEFVNANTNAPREAARRRRRRAS